MLGRTARLRDVCRGVLLGALLIAGHAPADDSLPGLAQSGDTAAALDLIAAGTDVGARSADGATALHWAAHRSDLALVGALLERGADPNVRNRYGITPLLAAAVEGDRDIVAALLDAGAAVDAPNLEGQTPLMVVARSGRVGTAGLLIERGADVNATEAWGGQSALMWAAAQRHADMIRLLLAHGAEVDARGTTHDWERLVTAEPRVKILHAGGFTALLYAAREGCVDCVDALVAGGADIDLADRNRGVTPLLLALLNRNFDTAARLVELGADVDKWDWWGRSPLFLAIDLNRVPNSSHGDLPALDDATGLDVARMLLERGANVDMRLKQQPPMRSPPNDRGSLDGSADAFIIAVGATALHSAAKASDDDAVRLLLEHGADVSLPNIFGITPMLAAAGVGHRYAVLRETPIRGAYKTGADALATVRILFEAGADFSGVGTSRLAGLTAAHGAAQEGWAEVIGFLADQGVAIDASDAEGATPRDLADAAGHVETVALLDERLGGAR